MAIIKSNRSLKNKDKKFVISKEIIKEFELKFNRVKYDRCGTGVFSVFKNYIIKKVKEKITKDLLLRYGTANTFEILKKVIYHRQL
jgi:hypothetical protein